jgi:hypothetical protein
MCLVAPKSEANTWTTNPAGTLISEDSTTFFLRSEFHRYEIKLNELKSTRPKKTILIFEFFIELELIEPSESLLFLGLDKLISYKTIFSFWEEQIYVRQFSKALTYPQRVL